MATLILTAAGQALGGALGGALGLGSAGSILGKAAGALAGGALDQALFGSSRTIETGQLADLSVQASNEGASLPRVYGRARLSGQVIWATNFEEVVSEETQGGKGGGGSSVTVRSYSYFANFAVALCEGPIARVGRIWADGKPLDVSGITFRVYTGDETQAPDPLIAAFQDPAPAYRGTAYVVFERLALEDFGNRLPQLSFEVIRPVDALETQVRAVTLIPGAGEFVYAPDEVKETLRPGVTRTVNRHVIGVQSDWQASLDELQALCSNLEHAALVVAWFGEDLRCASCSIRPRVEVIKKTTLGSDWRVAGLTRETAQVVSQENGRPALGGTPSDQTVIDAILDLKARGLKVLLYPFILMDIPAGNGLADPYGRAEQPAYPWRGRITCDPAPGQPDTADKTGQAVTQAAQFLGTAQAGDFGVSSGAVTYAGAEWSYRRFILHLAKLAEMAGGVDAYCIGTEMPGMSQMRGANNSFPFVDGLIGLLSEVRAMLGTSVKLGYAADWSEYHSRRPDDGSGDVLFHLDPLWSHPELDFIGIDNYLPLSDWRGTTEHLDQTPEVRSIHDLPYLRDNIEGGEYYDWYYANQTDRDSQTRTAITDTAHGEHWIFRQKDIRHWWLNSHHDRPGGVRDPVPTGWVPGSKPVWFTELGVPAVDKGSNQPNVFVDPKSSESAVPHYSTGAQDDLIQRRALEAALSWWDDLHPHLDAAPQPVSELYNGPMLDPARIYLWTWDARPYPAFPLYSDVWADGANWQLGHWLSGRLGASSLDAIINAVLADFGIDPEDCRADGVSGTLEGVVVAGPSSARQAVEPLLSGFDGLACDRGTEIVLTGRSSGSIGDIGPEALADDGETPLISRTRAQASEIASEMRLSAEEPVSDYRRRVAASRRLEGGSRLVETLDLSASASADSLQQAADKRLHSLWSERERFEFRLGPDALSHEPGDVVTLTGLPEAPFEPPVVLRIEAIEDAESRRIEAVRIASQTAPAAPGPGMASKPFPGGSAGPAHVLFMDLPKLADDDPDHGLKLAAYADPWAGSLSVLRSVKETGFEALMTLDRPAVMGRLTAALGPGPLWRFDEVNSVELELFGGHLQSRTDAEVFAGKNALAIRAASGGFEILQFGLAVLTGTRTYRLSRLLRGQRGTEEDMLAGAGTGADVVLLESGRVADVPLSTDQIGLTLNYLVLPQGAALTDPASVALSHAATGRGRLPFAPVHLTARRGTEGIWLSWIRQTRSAADSWALAGVPLGEAVEAYELDILGPDGAVLRSLTSSTPRVLYGGADELADFGSAVSQLEISLSQLSETAGRGIARREIVHVD
ncbi:glycoside hydrolase/phage tail family protein [Roseibium sp. RKSG952]|uniref:baseplate multidomain protein megatron n=1 Tax=Roseibium sp. RKSG952 TaxID=2529384 RepID=UPI0012BC67DF|nr:glycoside hydrolase/phage tail family protein [Roseibium sp. RKSG952]MTH96078.1 hypothetical protein [Roseibium sp. RKSG952]